MLYRLPMIHFAKWNFLWLFSQKCMMDLKMGDILPNEIVTVNYTSPIIEYMNHFT